MELAGRGNRTLVTSLWRGEESERGRKGEGEFRERVKYRGKGRTEGLSREREGKEGGMKGVKGMKERKN